MQPLYQYEEVAGDLERRIAAGEFAAPQGRRRANQLPSRAELVEHYQVTEPTVDRAMQILRVKGLTATLPGVGVFVKEQPAT